MTQSFPLDVLPHGHSFFFLAGVFLGELLFLMSLGGFEEAGGLLIGVAELFYWSCELLSLGLSLVARDEVERSADGVDLLLATSAVGVVFFL